MGSPVFSLPDSEDQINGPRNSSGIRCSISIVWSKNPRVEAIGGWRNWCRLNKKQQHVRIIDWLLVNVKIVEFYITRSKKLYDLCKGGPDSLCKGDSVAQSPNYMIIICKNIAENRYHVSIWNYTSEASNMKCETKSSIWVDNFNKWLEALRRAWSDL